MINLHKRFLLFLIGCIGSRAGIAYLAANVGTRWLTLMGYLAVLPVLGWLFIILTGARKTGPEVFGERIWWGDLRKIHAALYALFAWYAIHGDAGAWRFLAIDVLFGLAAFLWYHFS
jgi:hypothetical protein